jgi:hypothetical protein
MEPVKLKPNEILLKHGPAGWLIRRLQRYAMLGWVLAFVFLFGHFVLELADRFVPKSVVAVDAAGKLLGTIEYVSAASRSDDEIVASAMRFAKLNLSLNSETIFEDYAESMNMMDSELLAQTQDFLKSTGYLAKVKAANAKSRLEFARQTPPTLIDRRDMLAQVRLVGDIIVDTGSKDGPVSKPFDLTIQTKTVARNTGNTAGIVIVSKKDN